MDVDQPPPIMTAGLHPFQSSRWRQLFVLLLTGAMLLQSGPVQFLVQQVHQVTVQDPCSHCANGVCPRDTDGSCSCAHSEPADSEWDGVVLRSCDGDATEALAPVVPKWRSSEATGPPTPRVSGTEYSHLYHPLSPQRLGDEVFRPPRTTPPVRLT